MEKKITPYEVRDIAKVLLRGSIKEIKIHDLVRALKAEGYRVHSTFCIGACVSINSGLYVQDNTIRRNNSNGKI